LDRRLTTAIAVAALIALPAFTLRVLCVGRSCTSDDGPVAEVPFCSLPAALRDPIAAGFREGRSPDVLGVARPSGIAGGSRSASNAAWPGTSDTSSEVPLVFWGTGINASAEIPPGTSLDAVAPTIARIVGLNRPHPEVRSGSAIDGIATGEPPRLVLEIALEGVGTADLTDVNAELDRLGEEGVRTDAAITGSLPNDPAAILTTIGTGGTPAQHGITGTLIRDDEGILVEAWGPESPLSVIATLGDDLDERWDQEPHIGLVAKSAHARGLVGGEWYVDVDKDAIAYGDDSVRAFERILTAGFGDDDVPDLLAYSIAGSPRRMDRLIGSAVTKAEDASGGSLAVVVTATGTSAGAVTSSGKDVARRLERALSQPGVVEASVPGGVYLDQEVLVERGITEDQVLKAMRDLTDDSGAGMFKDVFPAIAVSFKRYC
jgi:hypothetical protein